MANNPEPVRAFTKPTKEEEVKYREAIQKAVANTSLPQDYEFIVNGNMVFVIAKASVEAPEFSRPLEMTAHTPWTYPKKPS